MKMDIKTLEYAASLLALAHFGERSICVWREFDGKPAILRLEKQHYYKEWPGCFSLYNFSKD